MGQQEPVRKGPSPRQEIPDKLYFRIGEVAKLCAVPAYVLRFWEGEFPQLKPNKGGTGQRLYRRRDVETAMRVKTLLYDEGYTIPGARAALKAELRGAKVAQLGLTGTEEQAAASTLDMQELRRIQKDLRDLAAMLAKPPAKQGVLNIRSGRVEEAEAKPSPKASVRSFPKPKAPTLYDAYDRLFDSLPESEPAQ